jgi:pyruvate dehydrogenase E2 component (dihydrolipoamide acetyltransferase)
VAPSAPEPVAAAPAPAPAPAPAEVGTAKGEVTQQELSRTQQVVARRMAESRATVPDFTISTEVDMEGCVALRGQLKATEPEVVPSFNDMIVKACARALREYPRANGAYRDGRFELFSRVNVGIAVAAQDSLVVPTIFDADRKSLGEIARDSRRLAGKVRDGSVTPPELSGGTFTVSNLGMYGVTQFNAVINPPQAAILAVGAMAPKPVVVDGEIVVRNRMTISLSCDHRILYGADAAEFLARIRALLEQPLAAFVL